VRFFRLTVKTMSLSLVSSVSVISKFSMYVLIIVQITFGHTLGTRSLRAGSRSPLSLVRLEKASLP
jgi:hypothetical protein